MNQDTTPDPVITDPAPVVQETPETIENTEDEPVTGDDDTEIVDNPAEIFSGDERRDVIGGVADVSCDIAEKRLSFTIVNTGEKTWDIDQSIGFSGAEGKINLQIFINNEEVNSGTPRYDEGELLFGPNKVFSDNCGGITELAPGEEVSCTTYPVPLNEGGAYSNKNRIWLDLPGGDVEYVTFLCE